MTPHEIRNYSGFLKETYLCRKTIGIGQQVSQKLHDYLATINLFVIVMLISANPTRISTIMSKFPSKLSNQIIVGWLQKDVFKLC